MPEQASETPRLDTPSRGVVEGPPRLPARRPKAFPLRITVIGTAAPKGSTKAFFRPGMKHPSVTSDCKRTKPWQESVLQAALDVMAGAPPIDAPVVIHVVFYLPRPKSAPRAVVVPSKKPDGDKLLRALMDGLTRGGVYRDDAQVVDWHGRKRFAGGLYDPAGPNGLPRAEILVELFRDALIAQAPLFAASTL